MHGRASSGNGATIQGSHCSSNLTRDSDPGRSRVVKDPVPLAFYTDQGHSSVAEFDKRDTPRESAASTEICTDPPARQDMEEHLDFTVSASEYVALVTELRTAIDPFDEFSTSRDELRRGHSRSHHPHRTAHSLRQRWVSAGGHTPLDQREEIESPEGLCLTNDTAKDGEGSMSREEVQQGLEAIWQTQRLQRKEDWRRSNKGKGQERQGQRWLTRLRRRLQDDDQDDDYSGG